MDVRLPDGRIVRNVPDGTTQAELERRIGLLNEVPLRERSIGERLLRGTGKAVRTVVEGAADIAAPFTDPITLGLNTALGTQTPTVSEGVSQLLTRAGLPEPEGAAEQLINLGGRVATGILGGNVVGSLGANAGRSGQFLSFGLGASPQDEILNTSKQLGYVVPPSASDGGVVSRTIEGISGIGRTAKEASRKNQATTQRLVSRALGLSDDTQLDIGTLSSLRAEAGKAYEVLENYGEVVIDRQFTEAMQEAAKGAMKANKILARDENIQIINRARKLAKLKAFDSEGGLRVIEGLREDADKAFRDKNTGLGRAFKKMADAVEGQIHRDLVLTTGETSDEVQRFRAAREFIAKTYSVQEAMNVATGTVDAKKLAKQLQKGVPLSGELRKVAEFASAFPDFAKTVTSKSPTIDAFETIVAGSAAAASNDLGPLSIPIARQIANKTILSGPGQRLIGSSPSISPATGGGAVAAINALRDQQRDTNRE